MSKEMDGENIVSLEEALKAKKDKGSDDKEKRSQANTLIDLAKEAELFHDKDGNCYAIFAPTGIERLGRFDPRGSDARYHVNITSKRTARPIRKPCNRR
jgi:hypothetical protein